MNIEPILFWNMILWGAGPLAGALMFYANIQIHKIKAVEQEAANKTHQEYKKTSLGNQEEILEILSLESLKDKELSHEDKLAYKAVVSQIFTELQPDAKVRINDSIKGFNSEELQKLDVTIRKEIEGQELLTVIKTHAGEKLVDVPDLKRFLLNSK